MNSTVAPPPPAKKSTKIRYIPSEIIEEILLNLRVKPLLRFSSVSKSWKSMILGSQFIKKNSSRAAVLGRERILVQHYIYDHPPSFFPLSAVSRPSSTTMDSDAALAFPALPGKTSIMAFCHELLCLEEYWPQDNKPLILWNPSIGECFKLPQSNKYVSSDGGRQRYKYRYVSSDGGRRRYKYVYGIGHDAATDDYKILRVGLDEEVTPDAAELYSLRSNSWKEIEPLRRDPPLRCISTMGVFLDGALHWLFSDDGYGPSVIISFDLSTEEYRELALPPELDKSTYAPGMVLTLLKGKLCLSLNYWIDHKFVLWMMEDYGVVESWTKKLEFDSNMIPCFKRPENARVMPFYLFEDGSYLIGLHEDGKLILVHLEKQEEWVFLSKDEETRISKHMGCYGYCCDFISEFFVYVESLVSPATWAGQRSIRLSCSDLT